METIEQYIQSQMAGRIERRGNSPVKGIILFVAGGIVLGLAFAGSFSSNLRTALLSLGFMAAAVGLVLAVLCLTGSLWHYYHVPTRENMRRRTVYLSMGDYERCKAALQGGDLTALSEAVPLVSSNLAIQAVYCRHMVLLQAGRAEGAQLEPVTPVVALPPERLASISWLPLR